MNRNTTILVFLLALLPALMNAQSEEIISKNKIASQTTYEYFIEEGLKDPLVERIEKYDRSGNMTEEKEMNKLGEVRSWMKYKFDAEGNKVEETVLDSKGKLEERFEWIYKDGLVVEKKYYDHKDRLAKRKEYKYEYRSQ
jgi:ATP adenylyltransferase/5',5'''-P-1,P-4-tetraphosphate phosphorylase II